MGWGCNVRLGVWGWGYKKAGVGLSSTACKRLAVGGGRWGHRGGRVVERPLSGVLRPQRTAAKTTRVRQTPTPRHRGAGQGRSQGSGTADADGFSCSVVVDSLQPPGFPVRHQLLELVQTHAHQVGDAIRPSGSFPMSPFFSSSSQSIGVSASASVLPMNIQD